MKGYKTVRCKKEYGTWLYDIIKPSCWNDFDAPIYRLFNDKEEYINDFAYYSDMKHYIETKEII